MVVVSGLVIPFGALVHASSSGFHRKRNLKFEPPCSRPSSWDKSSRMVVSGLESIHGPSWMIWRTGASTNDIVGHNALFDAHVPFRSPCHDLCVRVQPMSERRSAPPSPKGRHAGQLPRRRRSRPPSLGWRGSRRRRRPALPALWRRWLLAAAGASMLPVMPTS